MASVFTGAITGGFVGMIMPSGAMSALLANIAGQAAGLLTDGKDPTLLCNYDLWSALGTAIGGDLGAKVFGKIAPRMPKYHATVYGRDFSKKFVYDDIGKFFGSLAEGVVVGSTERVTKSFGNKVEGN